MINQTRRYPLVLGLVMVLSACSVSPEDYAGELPVFDMKSYFNGELEAWGLFQDYTGKVNKRFHVAMTGEWTQNQGVLDEFFTYSDGTTQRRTWQLTRIDEHNYTGTAGDVIGEAKGAAYGNALRWQYVLALPVGNDVYHVHFDDWMYLIDEHTVINRSVMSKLGVTLGEVILVFRKNSTAAPGARTNTGTNSHFNMPTVNTIAFTAKATI